MIVVVIMILLIIMVIATAGTNNSITLVKATFDALQQLRTRDEVEEWKVQRTLQLVREMGATTIVEFFPWPYVQPSPGPFDWGRFDPIVDHAEAQGLQTVAHWSIAAAELLPVASIGSTTITGRSASDSGSLLTYGSGWCVSSLRAMPM